MRRVPREHPVRRAQRLRNVRAGRAWTRCGPRDARPSCARGTAVQRSRGWTALRRAGRALPAHAWSAARDSSARSWPPSPRDRAAARRRRPRRGRLPDPQRPTAPPAPRPRRPAQCERCLGSRRSAARRGRRRTKAERADRQRRESPRVHRVGPSGWAAQFTPDSGARQHAEDDSRRQGTARVARPEKTRTESCHRRRRKRASASRAGHRSAVP